MPTRVPGGDPVMRGLSLLSFLGSQGVARSKGGIVRILLVGGGCRRIRDALPVRKIVGEITVRYQRIIQYNRYFYGF